MPSPTPLPPQSPLPPLLTLSLHTTPLAVGPVGRSGRSARGRRSPATVRRPLDTASGPQPWRPCGAERSVTSLHCSCDVTLHAARRRRDGVGGRAADCGSGRSRLSSCTECRVTVRRRCSRLECGDMARHPRKTRQLGARGRVRCLAQHLRLVFNGRPYHRRRQQNSRPGSAGRTRENGLHTLFERYSVHYGPSFGHQTESTACVVPCRVHRDPL